LRIRCLFFGSTPDDQKRDASVHIRRKVAGDHRAGSYDGSRNDADTAQNGSMVPNPHVGADIRESSHKSWLTDKRVSSTPVDAAGY
jgi:hypothetical protein